MSAKRALYVLAAVLSGALLLYAIAGKNTPAEPPGTAPANSARGDKIIAYYFHVTVRCQTCRTIERYSEETLKEYFAKELESGVIEWHPINVQLPENRHFIHDYKLFTRSLVLVLVRDGHQQKYKVLQKTWELVRYEKWFKQYVKKEVEKYLGRLT